MITSKRNALGYPVAVPVLLGVKTVNIECVGAFLNLDKFVSVGCGLPALSASRIAFSRAMVATALS
jgi:hypothetical protein